MNLSYFFTVTILAISLTGLSAHAQAPSITDGPPDSAIGLNTNPSTNANAPYSFTYTASGFTQTPTFSVTAGSLPTGLSLSSAGVISGAPLSADVGTTYTGTVTASDGVDTPATQNFSIAIVTTLLNTIPEGVVNINLPGATTTYVSLPLIPDPFYRGVVSSTIAVTVNTIAVDDSPAPWTAGALANLYFVKFLSGNEMGRVILITANTTNSLTLDTTDNNNGATVSLTTTTPTPFNVQAGDAFEIFPADTLASIFGDNTAQDPLLLTPGTAYSDADIVNVYNPTLLKFQSYFFSTTAGYWELKGSTVNANNTILYPYGALAVFRRVSTALSFSILGRVPEVPILTKVGADTAIYGSSGYPVQLTLSQLDLGPNWLTSTAYGQADILSLYSTVLLKFVSYFELPAPNSDSWRTKTSATNVGDTVTINPGDVVVLFQRGGASGAGSFLTPTMPYTLSYTDF